jgi:hypothetical protein
MSPAKDDLLRWRETSSDPRALTARAAGLVEAARDVAPASPETLARIKVQVLARRPSRAGRGLPLGLRFAMLAAIVLASVATAKGTMILWRRHVATSAGSTSSVRPNPPPPRPRARAAASEAAPVLPPVPAPEAPPVLAPEAMVNAPARAPHHRRTALVAPRPHPAEDAAATTEAQLVARALSRLRQANDPAGALVLLDQYARVFPRGILESEALSARLEAVIQMDDRKTALRLLDGRSAFAGRLGWQQLLTRAELRTSAGRHADGLSDFNRLLAPSGLTAPGDLERALYGRAVCLGQLGQDDRARADLISYQRRFPDGKHAAEVARLLKGAGPEARP